MEANMEINIYKFIWSNIVVLIRSLKLIMECNNYNSYLTSLWYFSYRNFYFWFLLYNLLVVFL